MPKDVIHTADDLKTQCHDGLIDKVTEEANNKPTSVDTILKNAQTHLDCLNLEDKIKLSPEQSNTVQTMERLILGADLKSVESVLHKFKDDPGGAKPILDVIAKDLASAGVDAHAITMDKDYEGTLKSTAVLMLQTNHPGTINEDSRFLFVYSEPVFGSVAWHHYNAGMAQPDMVLRELSGQIASNLLETGRSK